MNDLHHATDEPAPMGGDAVLADRVADLAERLRRGDPVDLDDCDDEELRELVPTIRMMADWSRRSPTNTDLRDLGDFRMVRELGRGGMGIVYEAIQLSLGRRVALKVLRDTAALDPRLLHRFHVEAQAAASLRHPNIVPVFELGSADGIAYYAMECVQGRDLGRIIRERREERCADGSTLELGRVTPRKPLFDRGCSFEHDVAHIARQAALGLQYAHASEVVHRDIKPSNLLIDRSGHVWITDFGLARIRGGLDLTQIGEALGTPRYMSPEQALARGTPLDGRTDIYSLGATLYELLTLAPPFPGDDRIDLLRRIPDEEPIPPRQIDSRISVELETIVLKAMAKLPEERYATAADLADDLGRFLEDRPIRACRPTPLQRAGKWMRRHRRLLATAAGAVVVLAIGVAAAGFQYTIWLRRHTAELELLAARANHNADLANRHRRLANRRLHAAQLREAATAIENGMPERAQDLLHDQLSSPGEDDPRDFTWNLLWRQAASRIVSLYGHERDVKALAVSPDGRTLASGGKAGKIRLWDLRTNAPGTELEGHALAISRLAFGDTGSLLASVADADGDARAEVLVWDVASGRELARVDDLDSRGPVLPVFLAGQASLRIHTSAPGSKTVEIRTYDLSHGRPSLVLRTAWRFDDDTRLMGAGRVVTFTHAPQLADDRWTVKDPKDGIIEWAVPSAHSGTRPVTASTPDGRIVAAVFSHREVVCREVPTGRVVLRYTSASPIRALAFSPDGRTLAAGCESGAVELRALATGRGITLALGGVSGPDGTLHLAFSPDGSRLATTGWVAADGTTPVAAWDVASGEHLGQYPGYRGRAVDTLLAVDGHSLVIASGPAIRRWFVDEKAEPAPPAGHSAEAWSVAFAPNGEVLASGSDDDTAETIKLWDAKTGRQIGGWYAGPGTTAALAFSPDGRILASAHLATRDNVRLWDVATGRHLATLSGHTARVRTLAFDPEGKLLASAGSDRTIRLWDVGGRRALGTWTGHSNTVRQLAFSPDGRQLASASDDSTVRLWNVAEGRTVGTLAGSERFTSVDFSPDGRMLAAADEDGAITLWDVETSATLGLLREEGRRLRALAFSPDSRTLASAGDTGPIRLWDVLTAQELHALPDQSGPVHSLAFAPDGSSLAYACHDGSVGLCRTALAADFAGRGAAESRDDDPGRSSRLGHRGSE